MPEHDSQAFQELFDSEPTVATPSEVATWVHVYQRLIVMMERQLKETRAFASDVHEPMQRYLSRENMTILEEEIGAFKDRLAHWSDAPARERD
ncbi:MAG TPA: hypothetical protein VMU65_09095 [Candidatus Saccharimonadales bacterium]|nr:hypothetical protein [Candidatus Saccharimonadales bacterium]